jgi:hypothetical protein
VYWEEAKRLKTQLGNWEKAVEEFNRRNGTNHKLETIAGWGRYLRRQSHLKRSSGQAA